MKTRNRSNCKLAALALASALIVAPVAALPLFHHTDPGEDGRPVPVYEYYHPMSDNYFVTGDAAEISLLESLNTGSWARRSNEPAFMAFDGGVFVQDKSGAMTPTQPVCRYFIPPASHFLSASAQECAEIAVTYPHFVFETAAAFHVWAPDAATGQCPELYLKIGGFEFAPVFRLWNARADTNHRLTTSRSERAAMIEEGWISEGHGPEGVAMCVPHWTN